MGPDFCVRPCLSTPPLPCLFYTMSYGPPTKTSPPRRVLLSLLLKTAEEILCKRSIWGKSGWSLLREGARMLAGRKRGLAAWEKHDLLSAGETEAVLTWLIFPQKILKTLDHSWDEAPQRCSQTERRKEEHSGRRAADAGRLRDGPRDPAQDRTSRVGQ